MIARLLQRIAANRPTREIDSEGEPYLRRVYLAHWGGWRVYLHKFVGADGERWLHDHPFSGLSLILSGGYVEEVAREFDYPGVRVETRARRWINWIPARRFHRITGVEPGTWTLLIHAPHRKGWGFLHWLPEGKGLTYFNPFDQADSNGTHWWRKPGIQTLAELEEDA